jgi:hypothetical protein
MPVMAIFRPKTTYFRGFGPKKCYGWWFCINNHYCMVKHVLGDNTVKFHSTPKKMMPIMAIFRPKMAYLRGVCIAIALVWAIL